MRIVRRTLDIALFALMMAQMSIAYIGAEYHEWIGVALGVLCLAHLIVNFGRMRGLARTRRGVRLAADVLLVAWLMAEMASGLLLSSSVAPQLALRHGADAARTVHSLLGHWGFVVMGVHLGLHAGGLRRRLEARLRLPLYYGGAAALVALGVWSAVELKFAQALAPQRTMAFMGATEPLALHLLWLVVSFVAIAAIAALVDGAHAQTRCKRAAATTPAQN